MAGWLPQSPGGDRGHPAKGEPLVALGPSWRAFLPQEPGGGQRPGSSKRGSGADPRCGCPGGAPRSLESFARKPAAGRWWRRWAACHPVAVGLAATPHSPWPKRLVTPSPSNPHLLAEPSEIQPILPTDIPAGSSRQSSSPHPIVMAGTADGSKAQSWLGARLSARRRLRQSHTEPAVAQGGLVRSPGRVAAGTFSRSPLLFAAAAHQAALTPWGRRRQVWIGTS